MSDNPDLTERLRRITLSAMLIPAVPLDPEGIDDMVDAIAELTELRADLATARKAVGEAYEECAGIIEEAARDIRPHMMRPGCEDDCAHDYAADRLDGAAEDIRTRAAEAAKGES